MRKPKYEVGDYVRIKSDLKVDYSEGLVPIMVDMAGQLVQISSVDSDDIDEDDMAYVIKELEGYFWSEDWFEYRLGNYEDNNIEPHKFKYVIGYKTNEDGVKIRRFIGFIENLVTNSMSKSVFIDENGKMLAIPWELIEYIVPMDNNNN